MVNYPASIDNSISVPAARDGATTVSASVVNKLRDSILAVQTELGTQPSGVYTNVKTRLNTLEDTVGSLQIITLTGDLGGTLGLPKVIGLQGNPISSITPTLNQGLVFNGTSWAPATLAAGTLGFTAGGDLSGTENNQTVIRLNGYAVTNTAPTDGYILTWDDAFASWKPLPAPVGFTAGGDLTGTENNQTVDKIKGNAVTTQTLGASEDGYALTWSNVDGYWYAAPTTSPNVSSYSFETVYEIDFTTQNNTTLIDGDHIIDGMTWTAENNANASSFVLTNGVGIVITTNGNTSDYYNAARTLPLFRADVNQFLPVNYNSSLHKLRARVFFSYANLDQSYEFAYPIAFEVNGSQSLSHAFLRGFSDGVSYYNMRNTLTASTNQTTSVNSLADDVAEITISEGMSYMKSGIYADEWNSELTNSRGHYSYSVAANYTWRIFFGINNYPPAAGGGVITIKRFKLEMK